MGSPVSGITGSAGIVVDVEVDAMRRTGRASAASMRSPRSSWIASAAVVAVEWPSLPLHAASASAATMLKLLVESHRSLSSARRSCERRVDRACVAERFRGGRQPCDR